MDGLVKVLHWAHATKGLKPNVAQIKLSMQFDEIIHLVRDKRLPARKGNAVVTVDVSDIPDDVIAPVRAYIHELTGHDPQGPTQLEINGAARSQHDWVLMSLRQNLGRYVFS